MICVQYKAAKKITLMFHSYYYSFFRINNIIVYVIINSLTGSTTFFLNYVLPIIIIREKV